MPQHDAIALAKQVVTIDRLSGGRFLFGVAAGWLVEEMKNHAVEPTTRWAVMREKVLAMEQIWDHDEPEFHGRYVDFDPLWLGPKPVQSPHPPVLVGGQGRLSLRAAVECGDGWMPIIENADKVEELWLELQRSC